MSTLMNVVNALRTEVEMNTDGDVDNGLQVAIALTIANTLKVPAVPVSSEGSGQYNGEYAKTVRELISEVNEHFYIDVAAVSDLVKAMYITRFNIVHRPEESTDLLNLIAGSLIGEGSPFTATTVSRSDYSKVNAIVGTYVREAFEAPVV